MMVIDPSYIETEWEDSTYDKIVDMLNPVTNESQACQLNYKMGHAGLGVAFISGFGDGEYEVYATYKDFGDFGKRITKVEIELISDDFKINF